MRPTRLGTAEWNDPAEFADQHRFDAGQFWLGRSVCGRGRAVGYTDDRHVCLVSGSRSGKGTTTIINNLCLWPGSIVVIDPKGENATVTAARRGPGSEHCDGMGQRVYVLDPFRAANVPDELRGRFNPLDALDPDDPESIDEAARLADAIVVTTESKDPFWEESARSMIKGLILHVLTCDEFEDRRTLLTIRELITRGDHASVTVLRNLDTDEIPSGQELLWEGVRRNDKFGGVISGVGEGFLTMATRSPKQFESVLQIANRNTEFLDSPAMKQVVEASDFTLGELKTDVRGLSIYLSLPQRYMSTHFRWLRLMISLVVTEMEATPGTPATGHRVLMCLDEFAGLRRMEVIENAVAQIAGFGVKLFFVLQSLEQLKATYKDNWETFLSNAGLKIFFGMDDHFSREYVSKLIGETEIVVETQSKSESSGTNESTTRGESESTSSSTNESTSRTHGGSDSRNDTYGRSEGHSWSPSLLFRDFERSAAIFRGEEQMNVGSNSSRSTSRGTNWGSSETSGRSDSETTGTSTSETLGHSTSSTAGTSQAAHKRALISPDEIGLVFARVINPSHGAYPGLGLVLISGERPSVVRRANYYEDATFLGKYDFHPDHAPQIPNIPRLLCQPPMPPRVLFRVYAPPSELLRSVYGSNYQQSLQVVTEKAGEGHTPKVKAEGESVTAPGLSFEIPLATPIAGVLNGSIADAVRGSEPLLIIEPNTEHPDYVTPVKFSMLRDLREDHDLSTGEIFKQARHPLSNYRCCGNLAQAIGRFSSHGKYPHAVSLVGLIIGCAVGMYFFGSPFAGVLAFLRGAGLAAVGYIAALRAVYAIDAFKHRHAISEVQRCNSCVYCREARLVESIPIDAHVVSHIYNVLFTEEGDGWTFRRQVNVTDRLMPGDVIGTADKGGVTTEIAYDAEQFSGPVYITGFCVADGDLISAGDPIVSFCTSPPAEEDIAEARNEHELLARYHVLQNTMPD